MHIATIIPIARGIPFDVLTYYVAEPLSAGTFVSIPFGRQTIYGCIVETIPLAEAKTFVKQASFSLKKIKTILGSNNHFDAIVQSAKETGALTLAPIGAVAGTVTPQILFEYLPPEKWSSLLQKTPRASVQLYEEKAVSGTREDRVAVYKRMIRSSFAKKESVIFIAPSIRSLEWWKEHLEKGIARHTVIFHSKVTKKTLRSQSTLLKQNDIPLVMFVTPSYISFPCNNIGTIIAEDESSNLYVSTDRYEIDTRIFIKQFAQHLKVTLLWGDTIPRFETLARTGSEHLPRTFIPEKLHVVPIEPYRTILPSEVIELIRHSEKKKKKIFIYTNRKGVAPLSRCADCGTIVECPECTLPMALRNRIHAGNRERFFTCLYCSTTLDASHVCKYCGGWNIVPVAIGTESIYDAVTAIIDPSSVVVIDDDTTPDSKMIIELIKNIHEKKHAVIIGTQKALPYIKKIHYAIIPFFDRLLSTPSLYTTEQILRLIMECNESVTDGVIICTKNPEFPTIKLLETQKINALIDDELLLRKQLGYPPYGTLLKISITVPESHRVNVTERVDEYLHELDATRLPARRIQQSSMKVLLSWLVKVQNEYIEDEGGILVQFMESLRFPYKIEQNPERL